MSTINDDVNQTYDAEALIEDISDGKEKKPKVNVEADYEASKLYSQSEVDQTGEGAEIAEAATAPQLEVPKAKETRVEAEPTGDPEDFRDMAKEINPQVKA